MLVNVSSDNCSGEGLFVVNNVMVVCRDRPMWHMDTLLQALWCNQPEGPCVVRIISIENVSVAIN